MLRPTKPQTASVAQQHGGVEHAQHEVVFLARARLVGDQHVVEVAEVGQPDAGVVHRRQHTGRALLVERLAQIERVRDRIEHRLRGHVALRGMQRGRELDVRRADVAGELQPFLDREIRIGVALVARRQLLQRGGQDAELHRPGNEVSDGHGFALM